MFDFITDAIFPRFCLRCGNEGSLLCDFCRVEWRGRIPPLYVRKFEGDLFMSSLAYADPVARGAIEAWKYAYDEAGFDLLADIISEHAQVIGDLVAAHEIEAIVPAVLHRRRYCERGFDQSVEIARLIAGYTGLPIWYALKRKWYTKQQSHLSGDERKRAMEHSPFCAQGACFAKRILIVDDVWTTGATARAAARALAPFSPEKIAYYTLIHAR